MRFNSPEHLEVWRARRVFPKIHDGIAAMAVSQLRGKSLLDLGCGFGLLGTRIVAEASLERGLGVDADDKVLAAGRAAGIPIALRHLRVTRDALPELIALMVEGNVDVLVGRRVLPELFGADLEAGKTFADLIAGMGVKEVLIEGRVDSEKSVNALHSIDHEVTLLAACYREVRRVGAVSYLVVR